MNQQTTASTNPQPRRQANGARRSVPPMKRRGPDPKLLKMLYRLMAIVSGAIALIGLLLLILPSFHVKEIRVEGNTRHTTQEIIDASMLEVGQETLALDLEKSLEEIYKNCKYVKSVRIKRTPFSVRIEVTEYEKTQLFYTEFNGNYYSLNRDFRVLSESESAESFEGFLFVNLPEISALAVGAELRFSNPDVDLSYVNEMIDSLAENGTLDAVTSLDVSGRSNVSYVMEDTCRVNFGKVGDTQTKLLLVDEILVRRGGIGTDASVIDVSDPQKPTYRQLSDTSLLMAE